MNKRLFIKETGEKQGKFVFLEDKEIIPIVQGDNSSIFYDSENGYFVSNDDEILEVKNDLKWLEVQDVQELLNIRPLTEELYKQYEVKAFDDDMYFVQGDNIYIVETDHNGYVDDKHLCYMLNQHKIDITEKMHAVDTYATGGTGFWTYSNINGWYIEIIEYDCIYRNWEELTEFNEYQKIGRHKDNFSSYEHYTNNDIVLTLIYSRFAGVHHTFIISNYNEVIDEIKEKMEV